MIKPRIVNASNAITIMIVHLFLRRSQSINLSSFADVDRSLCIENSPESVFPSSLSVYLRKLYLMSLATSSVSKPRRFASSSVRLFCSNCFSYFEKPPISLSSSWLMPSMFLSRSCCIWRTDLRVLSNWDLCFWSCKYVVMGRGWAYAAHDVLVGYVVHGFHVHLF